MNRLSASASLPSYSEDCCDPSTLVFSQEPSLLSLPRGRESGPHTPSPIPSRLTENYSAVSEYPLVSLGIPSISNYPMESFGSIGAATISSSSIRDRKLKIRDRLTDLLLARGNHSLSFRSVGNDEMIKLWCRKMKLLHVIQSFPETFMITREENNCFFVQLREDFLVVASSSRGNDFGCGPMQQSLRSSGSFPADYTDKYISAREAQSSPLQRMNIVRRRDLDSLASKRMMEALHARQSEAHQFPLPTPQPALKLLPPPQLSTRPFRSTYDPEQPRTSCVFDSAAQLRCWGMDEANRLSVSSSNPITVSGIPGLGRVFGVPRVFTSFGSAMEFLTERRARLLHILNMIRDNSIQRPIHGGFPTHIADDRGFEHLSDRQLIADMNIRQVALAIESMHDLPTANEFARDSGRFGRAPVRTSLAVPARRGGVRSSQGSLSSCSHLSHQRVDDVASMDTSWAGSERGEGSEACDSSYFSGIGTALATSSSARSFTTIPEMRREASEIHRYHQPWLNESASPTAWAPRCPNADAARSDSACAQQDDSPWSPLGMNTRCAPQFDPLCLAREMLDDISRADIRSKSSEDLVSRRQP